MRGTTSPARQADADGHARHAGTGHPATTSGDDLSGVCRPGVAVRIPPFTARQEAAALDRWPLQSFLELGALPSAVPCARLHTRHVLWDWRLSRLLDSTELLVSEMITNGVQVSRALDQAAVRLWLVSDRTCVVLLAWDASPLPPVRADPGADTENGRGLLLVEAISEQWGWYFPAGHGGACALGQHGKVVWAIVRLRAARLRQRKQ